MRRPATRSSCREEKLPGRACANARARSRAACGTVWPSASATAHTSATRRLNAAQAAAAVRISPIGSRTAAVMPACAQMKASLAHSTVLMLSDSSAAKPACSQQESRRCARSLARPSSSPNVMLACPLACRITPGPAISAKMNAAPPITWSSPTARASFSSFSTPFCSDTTAVSSPTSGPSRAAAASVSKVFTAAELSQSERITQAPWSSGRGFHFPPRRQDRPRPRAVASAVPALMAYRDCPMRCPIPCAGKPGRVAGPRPGWCRMSLLSAS